MKYVIFELDSPDVLKEIDTDGYYPSVIYKKVLKELDVRDINSEHNTQDSAEFEINKNSNFLKGKTLTILPIIHIDYSGEIR